MFLNCSEMPVRNASQKCQSAELMPCPDIIGDMECSGFGCLKSLKVQYNVTPAHQTRRFLVVFALLSRKCHRVSNDFSLSRLKLFGIRQVFIDIYCCHASVSCSSDCLSVHSIMYISCGKHSFYISTGFVF